MSQEHDHKKRQGKKEQSQQSKTDAATDGNYNKKAGGHKVGKAGAKVAEGQTEHARPHSPVDLVAPSPTTLDTFPDLAGMEAEIELQKAPRQRKVQEGGNESEQRPQKEDEEEERGEARPGASPSRAAKDAAAAAPVATWLQLHLPVVADAVRSPLLEPFLGGEHEAQRTGLYISSYLHASIASVVSLWLIAQHGMLRPQTVAWLAVTPLEGGAGTGAGAGAGGTGGGQVSVPGIIPEEASLSLLAFSFSYFCCDLIATMPDWCAKPSDLLHHLAGVALTFSCMRYPIIAKLGPHVLQTEASTPLLNIMWAMKKLGKDGTPAFLCIFFVFVAIFLATRQFYLLYVTGLLWSYPAAVLEKAGSMGVALLCLCCLNSWWSYKLLLLLWKSVQKVGGKGESKAKQEEGQEEQKEKRGDDKRVTTATAAVSRPRKAKETVKQEVQEAAQGAAAAPVHAGLGRARH